METNMARRRLSDFTQGRNIAAPQQTSSETLTMEAAEKISPRKRTNSALDWFNLRPRFRAYSEDNQLSRVSESRAGISPSEGTKPRTRHRAQSEFADNQRFLKLQTRVSADVVRSDSTGRFQFSRRRYTTVHAIDQSVLHTAVTVPDGIQPHTRTHISGKTGETDLSVTRTPACLICMGRATKKKPLIPIPCQSHCNLAPVHMKCIYEWKEQRKGNGTCPLCRSTLGKINYNPPDVLHAKRLIHFNFRKLFALLPVTRQAGKVKCYLKVRSNIFGVPVYYEMYLQAPNGCKYPGGPLPDASAPHPGDILLMVAKKRVHKMGISSIDISLDLQGKDFSSHSTNYLGQVTASSFSGLNYIIAFPSSFGSKDPKVHSPPCSQHEDTERPEKPTTGKGESRKEYQEACAIHYTQNRIGAHSGPRQMQVILPQVKNVDKYDAYRMILGDDGWSTLPTIQEEEDDATEDAIEIGDAKDLSDDDSEDESDESFTCEMTSIYKPKERNKMLTALMKEKRKGYFSDASKEFLQHNFIFAHNKKPYWLESINAHSLDFNGRVTIPSNKNFQLELDQSSKTITLQFGKVVAGEDDGNSSSIYTLDFSYPLSPLQAFGICISSCDRKIGCA